MILDEARRQEYNDYVNSPVWKRFRDEAIKRAAYRCQRCGISKWSVKLEVHHLTYERFKHERTDDVQVLCPDCHKLADGIRVQETENRNARKLADARFDGWGRKVYGERWGEDVNPEEARERYNEWRESKGAT